MKYVHKYASAGEGAVNEGTRNNLERGWKLLRLKGRNWKKQKSELHSI